MKLFSAPLQGYTEYPWRNYHNEIFGGIYKYYSPFMRIEHNDFRKKDIRDISSDTTNKLVPQIISCKREPAQKLIEKILELGYSEIDINFGCPFPPVTKKCMGAGMLPHPEIIIELLKSIEQYKSNCCFSIKSRLGLENNEEIFKVLPIFEDFSPTSLTIHPRIARQQYKGELDTESFTRIYNSTKLPLIFNGELNSVDDINKLITAFPNLYGAMLGRGLLTNPALAREFNGGKAIDINEYINFHSRIFDCYAQYLSGDAHLLAKIKPFWEYSPAYIDHKIIKLIKKSSTIAKYNDATYQIKL